MRKIELLAPAGGKEQYIAAVENGADAIYTGGNLFNARMKADNFSMDDLSEMIDYGHLRNVKTYITLNTLIDDNQFEKAVSYAASLYEIGADALIIQDLGLGNQIHQILPDFHLHLSTQASVFNAEGVIVATRMGYKRVVLARELSAKEMSECSALGETEVFIHGALCMCYSGQCQLSRHIGGRSGNKGVCAQPCRLSYDGKYSLSPKDLCTLEILPSILDAGVTSLKIEGRMKSPEYVATVVSVYRKYIDMYLSDEKYIVSSDDITKLKQSFNRGGFTTGYLISDPGTDLMSGSSPKNIGVYMGTVTGYNKNLMDINADFLPDIGDILEIHSKDTSSTMTLTYLEKLSGNRLRVGDIKAPVSKGDKVYRLISKKLNDNARSSYAKGKKKAEISLLFSAISGEPIHIDATDIETGISVSWNDNTPIEKAQKKPAEKDAVIRQLSKTGDTPFTVSECSIELGSDVFLPSSKINSARRQVLSELEEKKKSHGKRTAPSFELSSYTEAVPPPGLELYASSNNDLKKFIEKNKAFNDIPYIPVLPLKELMEDPRPDGIPYILPISKGEYDQWIRDNFSDIFSFLSDRKLGIYIGNIGWIRPFAEKGIKVFGDYGLNCTNSYTAMAIEEEGAAYCMSSLENASPSIEGAFPLMITEHELAEKHLTDRKNKKYDVDFDKFSHKTIIKSADTHLDINRIKELSNTKRVRIYI